MDLVDDSSMPFPPLDEDDDIEMCSRLSGVDTGRAFTPKETAVIYSREIDSQASTKSNGEMLVYMVVMVKLTLFILDIALSVLKYPPSRLLARRASWDAPRTKSGCLWTPKFLGEKGKLFHQLFP